MQDRPRLNDQDDAPSPVSLASTDPQSQRFEQLNPTARELLATYRDELLLWNQRFNLTAIADPTGVDQKLIGDALRLLPSLDRIVSAETSERPTRVIDIGTGAGFPGMVIKIARPELNVALVDATGKKVTFLQHVIELLELESIVAIHGRAEELGRNRNHRAHYDVATARAVSSLPVLLELAIPLLRMGGTALFPKGADIETELEEGRRAASEMGARIVGVELLPAETGDNVTQIVIAAKIRETPTRYPRRSGLPAREPLGRETR